MHILKPGFRMEDEEALAFASARGFGLLVASGETGPIASHVPFVIERRAEGVAVGVHVTARNPLAELADGRRRFLLVVSGPDAYVSNDWYVSPDQVSTWLYEAVHLTGPASRRPREANRAHGDDLLAVAEGRLAPKPPWGLDGMEPRKREAMLAGIVTLDIAVETIEGQAKLNQHKIDADHVAVSRRLDETGTDAGRTLAARMRALRPHLSYRPDE